MKLAQESLGIAIWAIQSTSRYLEAFQSAVSIVRWKVIYLGVLVLGALGFNGGGFCGRGCCWKLADQEI